jgi:hypothetical protein
MANSKRWISDAGQEAKIPGASDEDSREHGLGLVEKGGKARKGARIIPDLVRISKLGWRIYEAHRG